MSSKENFKYENFYGLNKAFCYMKRRTLIKYANLLGRTEVKNTPFLLIP